MSSLPDGAYRSEFTEGENNSYRLMQAAATKNFFFTLSLSSFFSIRRHLFSRHLIKKQNGLVDYRWLCGGHVLHFHAL